MIRALLVAGLVLSPAPATAGSTVEIEVGRPFPHLVLPTLHDGRPGSVADFRGQKLVLHVFASW